MLARLLQVVCCAVLLVGASACPRMRRLRTENARMEALATLEGRVDAEHWTGEPLMLVVMRKPAYPGAPVAIARRIPLDEPGTYTALLPPGAYLLGAFEDRNRNGRFDREEAERAAVYRELTTIDLHKTPARKSFGLTITDQLPQVLEEISGTRVEEPTRLGEGDVVALSAGRFAPENASLGVWQPVTFQERVGMGVFMLQAYDPARVPVLFVHGMSGHPREFETLIKCLDARYQPWVAQYASGWRLAPIARGLNYVLTTLQRKHGFSQLYLVAHSMGGLLARGTLREHVQHTPAPFITKFVTLCSPLGGMPSADKGVEMAPAVVPSWRDIGPRSQYVKQLYEPVLPPGIEYSLFFAYDDDDATDGVVSLASQLRREAQREALHMQGFETTHVGVLQEEEVCRALNWVLAGPAAPLPAAARVK